ncbi:hypothetical protein DSO57_1036611 [Entomophthora muscae]|uniref:Uncharacterized protein n=1 Tax=Entomophthora muscae TaxID=34485 RepID=A0ACC2UL67_9FUNG|nr:hypothetical protein DSO57_1036611 [Entomophthora muscae]
MSNTTENVCLSQAGTPMRSLTSSPSHHKAPAVQAAAFHPTEDLERKNFELPKPSNPASVLPYFKTGSPQEIVTSAKCSLINKGPVNLSEVSTSSTVQDEARDSCGSQNLNAPASIVMSMEPPKRTLRRSTREIKKTYQELGQVESVTKKRRAHQQTKVVTAPSDNSKLGEFSRGLVIQTAVCFSGKYENFDRCLSCIAKQTDMCRFKFFRCFKKISPTKLQQKGFVTCDQASFFSDQIPELRPIRKRRSKLASGFELPELEIAPSTYAPPSLSNLHANSQYVMSQLQAPLLLQLKEEQHFVQSQPTIFYRKPMGPVCQTCDVCRTGIFATFWLCKICGKEICLMCYSNWSSESKLREGILERCSYQQSHKQEHFIPVTNYLPETINYLCTSAKTFTYLTPPPAFQDDNLFSPSEQSLQYPYVAPEELTQEKFLLYWQKRQPILMKSAPGKALHQVTPGFFVKNYGDCMIDALKLDGSHYKRMSISSFFEDFDNPEHARKNMKIKDFPSTDKFSNVLPSLNQDFINRLPVPEYMNYLGSLNLVSLLPKSHIIPDLGPKIYIAYAGTAAEISGTTQLHLDAADAINALHYCSGPDGAAGAIWHLFRCEDAEAVRAFIHLKFPDITINDPIHDQSFYLNDALLEKLFLTKGIKPFIMEQKTGEVVLIPAGCPHQVRNLYPCIKLAMDYVSPEAASICSKLASEFRKLPPHHSRNVDIINTPTLLAQSWNTCLQLQGKPPIFQPNDVLLPNKRGRDGGATLDPPRSKRKAESKSAKI